MKIPSRLVLLTLILILVVGLLPLGIYYFVFGRTSTIQAADALHMLGRAGGASLLIDLRPSAAYQARHVAGAISLPLPLILQMTAAGDLPPAMGSKTLLLVCDTGMLSTQAARHLTRLGLTAHSVRGGMQDWGRAFPQYRDLTFSRFESPGGTPEEPIKLMSSSEQAVALLALLWIKPTYMILSGLVSVPLLRSGSTDLRILGWALLVFMLGEVFCAINYLFLKDNSYFAEYLHSYSMALAFSLTAYALLEGIDIRVLHISRVDKHCAMAPVCGECIKYRHVRCGMRRIIQLVCITLIVLAVIPLLAPGNLTAYNVQIFGYDHYYVRPFVHQWYESRYCPFVSVILTLLALLVLQHESRLSFPPLARLLFCGGLGFLGFSLFRVSLGLVYAGALVWATFWEELTELLFVGAVIYILWAFQNTLLLKDNPIKAFRQILR